MSEEIPLAAEYALRLLEGDELLEARNRFTSDSGFAAEVAWWEEKLAPLFDEISEQSPSPELWQRISERIEGAGAPVLALRRQLGRWRIAAFVSAAAALLLLVLQVRPEPVLQAPPPEQARTAPLLLASLAGEQEPDALTVAYRPQSRELVVTPARLAAPAGRARELWLIPEGGQPISLGLVGAGLQRRVLPPQLGTRVTAGATVALSDEPAGGSPTSQPTGAVVASGSLSAV